MPSGHRAVILFASRPAFEKFLSGWDSRREGREAAKLVRAKKNGQAGYSLGSPDLGLEASHVRCLQTLGALGDLELNGLTFVQRLVSIRHDCREMDEDVFAGLALNEAKTLASIEPLYCSLFFHLCFLFFYKKAI